MISPRRRYSLVRNDGAIWITGRIDAGETSAMSLRRSFREIDPAGPIRVAIDTPGGDCAEGLAMYVALRECGRPVEVTVRHAASMGALIAMAGSSIRIVEGGSFFLHPPGHAPENLPIIPAHMTAAAYRAVAQRLDRIDALHLDIFERRTRLPRSEIFGLCAANTTLDAGRAVALGFADAVIPNREEPTDG